MKVEEIKLAFETNVQFAVSNDIDAYLDKANALMNEYNDLQKQADLKAKMAFNAAKPAIELSQKAIGQAKDLGVPTTFFESRLSIAKDVSARASKSKINIL